MRICEVLNISLKDLYEGIDIPQEEISALEKENFDQAEIFSYDNKARSIILTKNVQKKNMLPQLLILEEQGKTHLEHNISGTEKFVYCLEGDIQININDKEYNLGKGSSLYFKSSSPHRFINIGKKTAKCLVVTSPVAL